MDIALWVAQGLLAAAFLMAGVMKLTRPKEKITQTQAWAEDFSSGVLKTIGALELVAAIGLIVPGIIGVAPVLVPLAAVGLILIQIAAIIVHARRSESRLIVQNLVFIAGAVFVALGRFGDYPL